MSYDRDLKIGGNVTFRNDCEEAQEDEQDHIQMINIRHRKLMRQKIKLLLLNRSSRRVPGKQPEHFIKDLTLMSAQIEGYLYRTASSFSEYMNEETLSSRILNIVESITERRLQHRNST